MRNFVTNNCKLGAEVYAYCGYCKKRFLLPPHLTDAMGYPIAPAICDSCAGQCDGEEEIAVRGRTHEPPPQESRTLLEVAS